jgi:uncharacterized membrane protein YedE/YeeE
VTFALALRLSTLSFPVKVLSFLITPFPDSQVFDPTLAFLALGALPISIALYQLATWLRSTRDTQGFGHKGGVHGTVPSYGSVSSTKNSPNNVSPLKPVYPPLLAKKDVWATNSTRVDQSLLLGAVIFGVGWGLEGICRTYSHS